MVRILHFFSLMVSFFGKVFLGDTFRLTSPSPSQGGGQVQVKAQNLKPTKNLLPPLGGGLGRGFFFLLLIFNYLLSTGQSFPVQILPQATPPPPIYFSHYADAGTVNSPLRVLIILNDFKISPTF